MGPLTQTPSPTPRVIITSTNAGNWGAGQEQHDWCTASGSILPDFARYRGEGRGQMEGGELSERQNGPLSKPDQYPLRVATRSRWKGGAPK
jgi:hypothetical protein